MIGVFTMKRLGLFLYAALATAGFAHAATLNGNAGATAGIRGADVALGTTAIAQMADNTPVSMGGVSCSDFETGITRDNSWWRRFYLDEHGAPPTVMIESVTVGAQQGEAPVTIRLYTIPHSVPADTLPTDQLTLIGASAETRVVGNLDVTTIPVSGTVIDAVNNDLVVEYHTDGTSASAFYAGGNATAQTHEAFISSSACGLPAPVAMSAMDFPDAHMIIVANAAEPAIALGKAFAPSVVNAATPSTLTITLANPFASSAVLSSDLVDTFPSGLVVAPTPNASTTCGGGITAMAGVGSVRLSAGASIPALGRCTLSVDVTSTGGRHDNVIAAGALQTDRGNNVGAASASLMVLPPGGNGIIHSGLLNRAVPATRLGVSYNIVTGAFSDAGPRDGGWDFNFSPGIDQGSADFLVLTLNTIAANQSGYMVDAGGRALVLRDGDEVRPDASFSSAPGVPLDLAWLAGIDAVVGMRFKCDGRLTYPVTGGLCYGYMRLATSNTNGFPARIIETAFEGNGGAITVETPVAVNPPAATLTPASLSFSVSANAVRTQSLRIANTAGSHPLQYAIAAQGESAALVPRPEDLAKAGSESSVQSPWSMLPRHNLSSLLPLTHTEVRGHDIGPWGTPGGIPYLLDDGSYEGGMGFGTVPAVWVNRFSVIGAQTINSVSIMWPRQQEAGTVVGLQANILAYYDASGSGDLRNAVRLGGDHLVTIEKLDTFETYTTHFEVPGAGDVYVGFVEHWAMNGYPTELFAVATDGDSLKGRSFLSLNMSGSAPDITDLANNEFTGTLTTLSGGYMGGNWLIRATGAHGACSGPAVPWLTATPTGNGNTVVGGASAEVIVKADPAAAALDPGTYTAELCITSNDPNRSVISVPVSLEVTAPMVVHACSHLGDSLFCNSFEGQPQDDIVLSGLINRALPRNADGISFNFGLGEWSVWPFHGDDFMPYWEFSNPVMMFYWQGDVQPGANGGVAATEVGPYLVLRSGDSIGPDSTFSAVANGSHGETAPFLAGVDGYLGFKFYNEQTRKTNYGYMRLITTWPNGYPATLVDYAYNRSGGPITIP